MTPFWKPSPSSPEKRTVELWRCIWRRCFQDGVWNCQVLNHLVQSQLFTSLWSRFYQCLPDIKLIRIRAFFGSLFQDYPLFHWQRANRGLRLSLNSRPIGNSSVFGCGSCWKRSFRIQVRFKVHRFVWSMFFGKNEFSFSTTSTDFHQSRYIRNRSLLVVHLIPRPRVTSVPSLGALREVNEWKGAVNPSLLLLRRTVRTERSCFVWDRLPSSLAATTSESGQDCIERLSSWFLNRWWTSDRLLYHE